MTQPNNEVCIIGGGLTGLFAALFLERQGRKVTLVEREPSPYFKSSTAASDIVSLVHQHPLVTQWNLNFVDSTDELVRGLLRTTGSLFVRADAPVHHPGLWEQRNFSLLSGRAVDSLSALRSARDSLIDGRKLASRLIHALSAPEVTILWGRRVVGVERSSGRWLVHLDNGQRCECTAVVNAAGPWANDILGSQLREFALNFATYAFPVAEVSGWEPGLMPSSYEGIYGDTRFGITVAELNPHSRTVWFEPLPVREPDLFSAPSGLREKILTRLREAFGEVSVSFSIERLGFWLGATGPDSCPVLGEDPDLEQFFWLTGFAQSGIGAAMGAAQVLADQSMHGESSAELKQFSPSRLRTVRALKRGERRRTG